MPPPSVGPCLPSSRLPARIDPLPAGSRHPSDRNAPRVAALTKLRRELFRKVTSPQEKRGLQGIRWPPLRNLDDAKHDPEGWRRHWRSIVRCCSRMTSKDELRQFWPKAGYHVAARFLTAWCRRAEVSGIRLLVKFARSLRVYRQGLLG